MKVEIISGNSAKSIEDVFKNRGVLMADILLTDEGDILDPFLLTNMEKAVEMLHKHLEEGSTIYIQQDSDADGMTSMAVCHQYIKRISPETEIIVGIHSGKQHGIDLEEVGKHEEVSLVIAPDASSNEHEKHEELKERGIDVIVLDHHEADRYTDNAVIVNPGLDDYPNKNISGVGVTQKFARAYDLKYIGNTDISDSMYDLVAIGKIADMIEINTRESVQMVQKGLEKINNLFLKELYNKQDYSLKGKRTPVGVSFYIAPMLNAVARAATQEEKRLVVEAMVALEEYDVPSTKRGAKEGDTETIQGQAVRVMGNIKSRQGRQVDRAIKDIEEKIEKDSLLDNKILIVDTEGEIPKEFTGLVANKLMAEHQRPVLIGSHNKGQFGGSGRSYDKSSLPDLRGYLNRTGLVTFAEGHPSAHGFGIDSELVGALIERSNKDLVDLDFSPIHRVDFEWDVESEGIDTDILNEVASLEPYWAKGLEEPLFYLKNVKVTEREIAGNFDNRWMKFSVGGVDFLIFRMSEEAIQPFLETKMNMVNLVGRVQESTYKGETKVQFFISELEPIKSQLFYF